MNITVYHYDIYIPGYNEPVDTKYCFSSAFKAIAKGRSLKKEYGAIKVVIENNDNFKTYSV